MRSGTVIVVNDWGLFGHPLFLQRFSDLVEDVEQLAEKDPDGFYRHPNYKLLEKVESSILERVPANPGSPDYFLGNTTLGKGNGHWRRVKGGLPNRYRLFFQFRSDAPKSIIYVWLNDEATLRKAGSKTDVYAVFLAKLNRGEIPSSFAELERAASPIPGNAG